MPPIALFDLKPGQTHDYPRAFLSVFSETIATDGYQVYHHDNASSRLILVARYTCFVNLSMVQKPLSLSETS